MQVASGLGPEEMNGGTSSICTGTNAVQWEQAQIPALPALRVLGSYLVSLSLSCPIYKMGTSPQREVVRLMAITKDTYHYYHYL